MSFGITAQLTNRIAGRQGFDAPLLWQDGWIACRDNRLWTGFHSCGPNLRVSRRMPLLVAQPILWLRDQWLRPELLCLLTYQAQLLVMQQKSRLDRWRSCAADQSNCGSQWKTHPGISPQGSYRLAQPASFSPSAQLTKGVDDYHATKTRFCQNRPLG